jgi:hypothetical protein
MAKHFLISGNAFGFESDKTKSFVLGNERPRSQGARAGFFNQAEADRSVTTILLAEDY